MVVTFGQQYYTGEKPTVILYTYTNYTMQGQQTKIKQKRFSVCVCVFSSHTWPGRCKPGGEYTPAQLLLLLLFLTFSALVANPKKTTLHGGQSRSWSAEQGK